METTLGNTWERRAMQATERKEPQPMKRTAPVTPAPEQKSGSAMSVAGLDPAEVRRLAAKFGKNGVQPEDKNGVTATSEKQVVSLWLDVTPDMARRWMTCNFRNRPMRDDIVAAYARDMAAGRWQPTHQGIAFNDCDQLIDGQHRLAAIIKFGKPVRMMVTFGLASKIAGTEMTTMDCVDRGAARSVGDQLKIQHGLKNSNQIAQVTSALAHLCYGERIRRLSVGQTLDIYREFQTAVDFVIVSRSKDNGLRSAGVLAAFAFVHPLEASAVVKMFTALNSGRELEQYPVLKLLHDFLTGEQATMILSSMNRGIAELVVWVLFSELQNLKLKALEMKAEKWTEAVEHFRALQAKRVEKIATLFKLPK